MILRIVFYLSDQNLSKRIESKLCAKGLELKHSNPTLDNLHTLGSLNPDLLFLARESLPDQVSGRIVDLIGNPTEPPAVIVFVNREDPTDRAALLAAGCEAVLNTEIPLDSLAGALETALERRREYENAILQKKFGISTPRLQDFESGSSAMTEFMRIVQRLVDTDASLLILGETGVGKERLARAIHEESPRSGFPFVTINCGALSETLLESELFGHEREAFTGAQKMRKGWIELADRGTLFLDEIGDMPLHLQVKLLRVLQDRTLQRLGSERDLEIDIRVMAATNRALEAEAENGNFRRDLYYRLSVVTLTVPSLRDRSKDIPGLVERYLHHFNLSLNRKVRKVAPEALDALCHYHWPGNIRELMNILERAVILCVGNEITMEDLPQSVLRKSFLNPGDPEEPPESSPGAVHAMRDWAHKPWSEVRTAWLSKLEKTYLSEVLASKKGKVGEAARVAGMNPRSLHEKMKHYSLNKENFR